MTDDPNPSPNLDDLNHPQNENLTFGDKTNNPPQQASGTSPYETAPLSQTTNIPKDEVSNTGLVEENAVNPGSLNSNDEKLSNAPKAFSSLSGTTPAPTEAPAVAENKTTDWGPVSNTSSPGQSPEPNVSSTPMASNLASDTNYESLASDGVGIVVGGQTSAPQTQRFSGGPMGSKGWKNNRLLKVILMCLLVLVVLGGGSAAAYVGFIVPNRPANVLKSALINSVQQKQVSFASTINIQSVTGSGVAYKATISGSENSVTKAVDAQVNLTVSGVTFPAEIRFLDGNLYFKLGNLSDLAGLINSLAPSESSLIQAMGSKLSNQWFVVDSTIIDETGAHCTVNSSWSISQSDINLLESQYNKHQFVTIDSTSNVVLNGSQVEKFVISINDNKGAAFFPDLNNLSLLKSIQSCAGGNGITSGNTASLADNGYTPLTVWVNKSTNKIVQIASQTTAQDAKSSNLSGNATVDFNYSPITITVPQNAESVTQLLSIFENSLNSSSNTSL